MARYDRIALLSCPERDGAFPGWLVFGDLRARERDADLGRRARLRFLALRPVHRLIRRGPAGVSATSLERQINAVREELGHLPHGDPERVRLSALLRETGRRSPGQLGAALLDLGEVAEEAGHGCAAEEFYRTALELAHTHALAPPFHRAAARLARVLDADARPATAPAGTDVPTNGASDPLADGELEEAVRHGWHALRRLGRDDPARDAVLLMMGVALGRLGLRDAAAAAVEIVARRGRSAEERLEARIEAAALAEQDGIDAPARALRDELRATGAGDPFPAPLLDLALARVAMIEGDEGSARDHLRRAIGGARTDGHAGVLERAEALLTRLEATSDGRPDPAGDGASDGARAIAARVVALGRELAPAG